MGANGLVALGERERGLEWARRALSIDPGDAMLLYNIACIYSLAGELEEALACLERALDAGLRREGVAGRTTATSTRSGRRRASGR